MKGILSGFTSVPEFNLSLPVNSPLLRNPAHMSSDNRTISEHYRQCEVHRGGA